MSSLTDADILDADRQQRIADAIITAATRRTNLSQLLSLETVELATVATAIAHELFRRKAYVLKYGIHEPKR